jgi:hypothetical protein
MNRIFLKFCLLIFAGTVCACLLRPPTALGQVQGFVKNRNGNGLANVRITVVKGFTTCSDNKGWYSLKVTPAPCRSIPITCRKQGYKLGQIALDCNAVTGTMTDIFLDDTTRQRELWGTVRITKEGVTKQGVKVNLYRKDRAGESYVDTAVTCSDGTYSFSELADGLYKIVPECSVCKFSPAFHDNVQIPCNATAPFDFRADCTPGACQ